MRKETAADSAATMVVAVRVANPDRSAGWGQREMAQQLCELEAADRHHSCALRPLTQCGHRQALSSPLPSFQLQLCLSLPLHSHSLFSLTLSSMSFPATVHLGGSFRVLLQLCPQYYHTYLHSNNSHRLVSIYYMPGTLLGASQVYSLKISPQTYKQLLSSFRKGRSQEDLDRLRDLSRVT